MNPFAALVRRIAGETKRIIEDTQRQAPGARMIGEFTVRHAMREIRRRVGGMRGQSGPGSAGEKR